MHVPNLQSSCLSLTSSWNYRYVLFEDLMLFKQTFIFPLRLLLLLPLECLLLLRNPKFPRVQFCLLIMVFWVLYGLVDHCKKCSVLSDKEKPYHWVESVSLCGSITGHRVKWLGWWQGLISLAVPNTGLIIWPTMLCELSYVCLL